MNLEEFFRSKYAPIRLLGRSKRTSTLYIRSIRLLSRTLGREAKLSDLNDYAVANHLQALLDEKMAPATVAKERSQLLALANFAAKRGLISTWLDVPTIPVPERIPQAWTLDELAKILQACMKAPGFVGGVNARCWWTSIHLALWDTGERIGGLLGCRWDDYRDGVLIVRAEYRKRRTRDKLYQLGVDTVTWIERTRLPVRPTIWPWTGPQTSIYAAYERVLTEAGVVCGPNSKFHRMRRSVASHLKALGGDPTTALDHANPRTTRAYLDPRIVCAKPMHEILPRITGRITGPSPGALNAPESGPQ